MMRIQWHKIVRYETSTIYVKKIPLVTYFSSWKKKVQVFNSSRNYTESNKFNEGGDTVMQI